MATDFLLLLLLLLLLVLLFLENQNKFGFSAVCDLRANAETSKCKQQAYSCFG